MDNHIHIHQSPHSEPLATKENIEDLADLIAEKLTDMYRVIHAIHHETMLVKESLLINNKNQIKMAKELDELTNEVSQVDSVIDSAITTIEGLSDKLDEAIASNDPAKLSSLAADLRAKKDQLAAAIVANTPAEPTSNPIPPSTDSSATDGTTTPNL